LACGYYSGEAERGSGVRLKLFGLILESVFTFILEHCSGSSRNAVRHHPGTAFTFARNPHPIEDASRLKSKPPGFNTRHVARSIASK